MKFIATCDKKIKLLELLLGSATAAAVHKPPYATCLVDATLARSSHLRIGTPPPTERMPPFVIQVNEALASAYDTFSSQEGEGQRLKGLPIVVVEFQTLQKKPAFSAG